MSCDQGGKILEMLQVGLVPACLPSDPAFVLWRVNLGEVNPSPPVSEKQFWASNKQEKVHSMGPSISDCSVHRNTVADRKTVGSEPGKGIAEASDDSSELCQHAARPGNQCKCLSRKVTWLGSHLGKTSMKGTDCKEKDPGGPTLGGSTRAWEVMSRTRNVLETHSRNLATDSRKDHRAWWGLQADLSETKEIGVSLDRTERQLGSLFVLKHKENFGSHWYLKWIRAQRLCKSSKGEQRRQLLSSCGETAKSILVNMVVLYIKFLNLQQPKGQLVRFTVVCYDGIRGNHTQ